MAFELTTRFVATPARAYDTFSHMGGVLMVPGMYGEELSTLGSAWWSETGERFVSAPIVGELGPTPSLRGSTEVQATGVALRWRDGRLVHLHVGPQARFEPSPYEEPPEGPRVEDLIIDASGTWWLSGYTNGDEARGRIYRSTDGAKWTVAAEKHWAVARLLPHEGRLFALHYKQISEVTAAGLIKLSAAKAHQTHAAFPPGAILTVGEGLVTLLTFGAKRAKYGTSPVSKPQGFITFAGGVLMGGAEGLFHSKDGLEWERVAAFTDQVAALAASRSGPLVVSAKGEVLALTGGS